MYSHENLIEIFVFRHPGAGAGAGWLCGNQIRLCPEPRSVDGDAASAALHEQALRALDARMFVIKGDEFYLPGDKIPVKQSPDSYISMQGTHAVIRLSPNLFPRSTWRTLNIEDDAAEMTLLKRKRNGDLQYRLLIVGPQNAQGPGGDRDAV